MLLASAEFQFTDLEVAGILSIVLGAEYGSLV